MACSIVIAPKFLIFKKRYFVLPEGGLISSGLPEYSFKIFKKGLGDFREEVSREFIIA